MAHIGRDNMRHVNIYTETTFKGLKTQNGVIGYVLELITNKEPITLDSTEILHDIKPNRAELAAIIKALKRMNEKCELTIFTESSYVANAFNSGWMAAWKENGYKTARGKDVANREEWEQLDELLTGHIYEFRLREEHSYRNWLKEHVNKVKEYENV
jgi:ribonuclease HI